MNIRPMLPQMQNPDVYATQYAQQNGISLNEAKNELKVQYGEPQRPQEQSLFAFQNENNFENISFEFDEQEYEEIFGSDSHLDAIPNFFTKVFDFFRGGNDEDSQKQKDPEVQARQYAKENGISIEEAREELRKKYGEPEQR
ncbi:hypothetical protein IJ425_08560 [bacterium]|nr:hypothetical protein [bacterium]